MGKMAKGTWLLIIAVVQSAIETAKTIMTTRPRKKG